MRRYLSLLVSCLLLLLLSACQMRGTVDKLPNTGSETPEGDYTMIIEVDWSEMEEDPTGMTLLFYPSDGSMPYVRMTNSIYRYVITLPEDDYGIVVFNQSETEFSTINFLGLDKFETAHVEAVFESDGRSRVERLFGLPSQNNNTRAKSSTVRLTPNFGSDGTRHTTVTGTRAKSSTVRLTPNLKIGEMRITVRVAGLTRNPANAAAVAAVNGALSGLSAGYYMGLEEVSSVPMTQELDDWDINYCESSSGVGSITTSFGTFGISPTVNNTRSEDDDPSRASNQEEGGRAPSDLTYVEDSPEDDEYNILYLNFRLSDGTYVPYRFDVTHRIIERTEIDGVIVVSVTLELNLGVGIEGVDDGLDEPLVLPATGIPYESGGISVKEWGDTIYTVVPLE